MIAYEELVVALTNWRIQQGLGTTELQFNSQRSGVNLDLPVADPDSLVEEIVDADYTDEIVSMDEVEVEEVEVLEAMEDPNSLAPESDTVLYDDGEHTSIAEAGSFSPPSEEGSEELVAAEEPVLEAALDYGNDDTQYMEAPSSPDEVSGEVSGEVSDGQEAEASGAESEVLPQEDDDVSALEASEAEGSIESELAVDEPIDAGELEVEEHELVEEQEVIDASGLEESVEVDPSAVSEFDENESTQMGMGASLINLAPGSAKPDDE